MLLLKIKQYSLQKNFLHALQHLEVEILFILAFLKDSHRTDELMHCKLRKNAVSGPVQHWQELPDFSNGQGAPMLGGWTVLRK